MSVLLSSIRSSLVPKTRVIDREDFRYGYSIDDFPLRRRDSAPGLPGLPPTVPEGRPLLQSLPMCQSIEAGDKETDSDRQRQKGGGIVRQVTENGRGRQRNGKSHPGADKRANMARNAPEHG